MKKPVLFIVFNRLDTTRQVFHSIREYQPRQLYIAADGPRQGKVGESEKCESVRKWVLSQIDWTCEVKTSFRPENLGCGKGPANAISWFFDHVEEGIILEDDCVPSRDFFTFCELLLEYYHNDNRISIISGCNFDKGREFGTADSYFYSVFPYTWGWATWKRNWTDYDYTLSQWKTIHRKKFLKSIWKEKEYHQAWKRIFDPLFGGEQKNIWDYQFFFQCFRRRQLSVVPNVNLVTNIGYGEAATHTSSKDNPKVDIKPEPLSFPLVHPGEFKRNTGYDVFLQELNYGVVEQVTLFRRFKRLIKRLIGPLLNRYA